MQTTQTLGIQPPDIHHLNAAIGWLGLGCAADARLELENISVEYLNHTEVLETRWLLCTEEKNWEAALEIANAEIRQAPEDAGGWLHRAYALRRSSQGGLIMAWGALLPAAQKFPNEPVIAYNLSCYACQLKFLEKARDWFKQAVKIGNKEELKKMALLDDDLQALWQEIKLL